MNLHDPSQRLAQNLKLFETEYVSMRWDFPEDKGTQRRIIEEDAGKHRLLEAAVVELVWGD